MTKNANCINEKSSCMRLKKKNKFRCHMFRVSHNAWMNDTERTKEGSFTDGKGCARQSTSGEAWIPKASQPQPRDRTFTISLPLRPVSPPPLFDKSCRNLSRGRFQWYCRKPRLPPLYYWSCSIQGACCRCKSRPLLAWMPIQLASVFSRMVQANVAYFSTYLYFRASISLCTTWLPKVGLTKDALWIFVSRYL